MLIGEVKGLIDEKKFREALAQILSNPRYTSLSTGAYQQLSDDLVEAAKECSVVEETEATEETVEEAVVEVERQ